MLTDLSSLSTQNLIEEIKADFQKCDDVRFIDITLLETPWGLGQTPNYVTTLYDRFPLEDTDSASEILDKLVSPDIYCLRHLTGDESFLNIGLWFLVELTHSSSWFELLWQRGHKLGIIQKNLKWHLGFSEKLYSVKEPLSNHFTAVSNIYVYRGEDTRFK